MKTTKISTILVLLLGLMICQAKVKGAIDGSGTANHIPKFTDPNTLGDSIIYEVSGNVGIGTTEPVTKLHVESGGVKAVFGKTTASGGIGVEGQARNLSGKGVGVYGKSYSTNGVGVFGIAAMNTGKNCGVYGQSQSPDGWAGRFDGRGYFSGKVGIGTTNPTRDLHIYRNVGPANVGIVTADTSSKAQVIFGDGVGNKWTISSDNTDDNKLHFRSGHFSGTPRVTFQQNGNVGIGTTVPSSPLNIKARNGNSTGGLRLTSSINENNVIYLQDASPGDRGQIAVRAGGSNKIVLRAKGNSYFNGGNVGIGTDVPEGPLHIADMTPTYFGLTKMDHLVVKGYGFVGIGTADPRDKLEINGNNTPAGLRAAWGSKYPDLYGEFKHDGSGGLKINANAKGGWADMSLQTDGTTRLFIESAGKVGIGTTNPRCKLEVNGKIGLTDVPIWDGPSDHDLTWTGLNIARESSSRRYKQNIRSFQEDFRKILRLEAKQYQMREGYGEPGKWLFGYIAEDVEEVGLTKLVNHDAEGRPDGIKYKKMAIYLIEIVKEHEQDIAKLKSEFSKLESLKKENADLHERIKTLESLVSQLTSERSVVRDELWRQSDN